MFSLRLCATTAVLLLALTSKCGGNGPLPDDSWFDDEKVYTFSYNSRSLLGHSNITTDAQVCDREGESANEVMQLRQQLGLLLVPHVRVCTRVAVLQGG